MADGRCKLNSMEYMPCDPKPQPQHGASGERGHLPLDLTGLFTEEAEQRRRELRSTGTVEPPEGYTRLDRIENLDF